MDINTSEKEARVTWQARQSCEKEMEAIEPKDRREDAPWHLIEVLPASMEVIAFVWSRDRPVHADTEARAPAKHLSWENPSGTTGDVAVDASVAWFASVIQQIITERSIKLGASDVCCEENTDFIGAHVKRINSLLEASRPLPGDNEFMGVEDLALEIALCALRIACKHLAAQGSSK
jgi:hypothetical protein